MNLIERLREHDSWLSRANLAHEAADEIERLTAERDMLVEQLNYFATIGDTDVLSTAFIKRVARDALAKIKEGK